MLKRFSGMESLRDEEKYVVESALTVPLTGIQLLSQHIQPCLIPALCSTSLPPCGGHGQAGKLILTIGLSDKHGAQNTWKPGIIPVYDKSLDVRRNLVPWVVRGSRVPDFLVHTTQA